jgi:hypothetical protein
MFRRPFAGVVLCLAAVILPAATSAETNPLTVSRTEPLDGTKIAVERIAASSAGSEQRWRLNLDILVANSSRRPYRLVEAEVCYPEAPVTCQTKTPDPAPVVPAGAAIWVQAPEDRDHRFPVAPAVRVVLKFAAVGAAGETALIVNKSLTEWKSRVAGGAYLFPGKRTDLPDSWYWTDGQNHTYGSNHRNSDSQRFAYDLVVRRWNGKEWTNRKPGTSGNANSHSLVWDMPVYAMADGWVLRCFRTVHDNRKPGVEGSGGGNSYRIVHADGEVALYAHLRKDSVPEELCPTEGTDFTERKAPKVRAGQFLGRVGNSGHSKGPHLHVHLGTTGQKGEQGIPILLRNVRTRFAGETWAVSKPCDPKNPSFVVSSPPAAVSRRQLIEPLYPAGAPEIARHGLPEACYQDVIDELAASGYQPFWFDGYDVAGKAFVNVVFRPGGGNWVMRHSLSSAAYQSEITSWVDKGYKPTLVESHRLGDSLRYAFVASKRSSPGFGAYHGRSAADHQSRANDFKAKGFAPVSMAVVSLKGKLYYTALWEKTGSSGWLLSSTLTSSEYQKWLETNSKSGRRLVYVNAYHHDGESQFSAVVSSSASASYAARHDLTAGGYQTEYEKWTGQGLRTQVVTGYKSGSAHRFAALWR